jgi:hypothetical protein
MVVRACARSAALIGLTLSQPAGAEPAPSEAAAALTQAHELGKRGDAEAACVLFEKSARLSPSADALLNAGICREYRSDLVGALDAFEKALALAAGQPQQQAAIQPRIDALRPRIPSVTIVAPKSPGTVVELDAQRIERFGTPLHLNPGEHRLTATAPRARPHTETLSLMPGQLLTVNVPELAPDPAPVPPVAPAAPRAASSQSASPTPETSRWRTPLVYGGVGLFAVGGAFSAWQFLSMSSARSRKHDLADLHSCNIDGDSAPSPTCDATVQARIDDIYHDEEEPARRLALVGLVASGAGAAAALVGFFALPERSASSGVLDLQLGPNAASVRFRAAW